MEKRLQEVERRLEESVQEGETLRQETSALRLSLQQETELKNTAEGKIGEVCCVEHVVYFRVVSSYKESRNVAS